MRILAILAATTALLGACADAAGPADFELPAMDPSLDPDDLSVGDYIATPCGDNAHLAGQAEWAFVDIFFGRASEHDPLDAPQDHHVRLVWDHGGSVVHRFNVPAVRAWIRLDRIPPLVRDGFWVTVRDVPDPARYDHPVSAGFSELTDADIQQFRELGGRVEHRWDFIDAIHGPLPDRSIPALRAGPRIDYVEPTTVYCLAGDDR